MEKEKVVRMLGGNTKGPVKGDQKVIFNALNTQEGVGRRTVIGIDLRHVRLPWFSNGEGLTQIF
jgi:hypothetical protein